MTWLGEVVATPLGSLMRICYLLVKNYGLAIILFTMLTKMILLPVSIWVHKNSIKMVKMQPEINNLRADFFGDADRIADGQADIYKKYGYNPFASIIPLLLQVGLLVVVVKIVYNPLTYILHLDGNFVTQLVSMVASSAGLDVTTSTVQLSVVAALQDGLTAEGITADVAQIISQLDLSFLGFNLAEIPSMTGGRNLWSPVIAGASAWLLCEVQNRSNVLQSEQSNWNKYGMMAFSIGLSLYLGFFVPTGVGLYWTASNLMAILQLHLLNRWINPKKQVNYAALEESKKRLLELEALGKKKRWFKKDTNENREKADYKRFFSIANKHLVFYSEKSGFYKYFEDVIEYLLIRSNIVIHYVTSDSEDAIFEKSKQQPRIKAYYIGEKRLITLMMKMDADIVVMTMSDLDNFHIKRSYVRKDIEYIYLFHYPLSTHMVLHKGALDHYDTIFCVGDFQFEEIRQWEGLQKLPQKKLISCGYGQLEKLQRSYRQMASGDRLQKKVLIAPSWQQDNILDSCIDSLLNALLGRDFQVVVRPHPEYVKRYGLRMDAIVSRYADYSGNDLTFELDFTSNNSLFDSDIVITDWSGAAYEFAFVTQKPVLFINTPPKINNPEYDLISVKPLEITLRSQMGAQLEVDQLPTAAQAVRELLSQGEAYYETIGTLRSELIANFGHSGEVGGRYILTALQQKKAGKQA